MTFFDRMAKYKDIFQGNRIKIKKTKVEVS